MQTPRTPPAFIPTLTREWGEEEAQALQKAPLLVDVPLLDDEVPAEATLSPMVVLPPVVGVNSAPSPTAFVPTRPAAFEVAPAPAVPALMPKTVAAPAPVSPPASPSIASAAPPAASPAPAAQESRQHAEQLNTRLLQRVDVILQRRVREAAAAVALAHAQELLRDIQPAIELAIREAVNEALELELSQRPLR